MSDNGNKNARVTLSDVAAAAGVSRMAAYAALNPEKGNTIRVGPSARARIHDAAGRLGYIPNHAARALVSGESRTIGFLLAYPDEVFERRLVQSQRDAFGPDGYALHVEYHHYSPDEERAALEAMFSRGVDALFVSRCGLERNLDLLRRFVDGGAFVTILGEEFEDRRFAYVDSNSEAEWPRLTRHLRERGYREAYFLHQSGLGWSAMRRRERFLAALEKTGGMAFAGEREVADYAECEATLREWTSRASARRAVVCYNDRMAEIALCALRALGADVPGRVGVTGYDGLDDPLRPMSITSIRFPMEAYAEQCRALFDAFRSRTLPLPQPVFRLDAELVLRESTGAGPEKAVVRRRRPAAARV